MRLIKMFGLAALAAVAAMAFVGATSASATSTQLCKVHTALTCSEAASNVSMSLASGTVGKLLNSLATVLCLNVSGSGEALALGAPQAVHVNALSFSNCGTNSGHTNCEVEVTELPLANLLKTGLDEGSLTGSNGKTHIHCTKVTIFNVTIDCEYDATGLLFTVGAQHLTANKTAVNEIGSDVLCPDEPTLDGLLKTTENRYVLG